MNFWDLADVHYEWWTSVPDHYNSIQDLPRVPLKIWIRSGTSSRAILRTSFISLKAFATRFGTALNTYRIFNLPNVECTTFEEKWNMIMACFGSFYIEAVALKDLVFMKASKVVNRKSASVAWNTLGLT